MESADEQNGGDLEKAKLAVDVMKHVTTLSTGTIVLVVTLSEKIKVSGWVTTVALNCMVTSLTLSLIYLFLVGFWDVTDTQDWAMVLIAACSLVVFLGGLGWLAGAAAIQFSK